MTRDEILQAADHYITKTSVQKIDGYWQIIGKNGVLEPISDCWDVWLCRPDDLTKVLSGRMISERMKLLHTIDGFVEVSRVTGEAWGRVPDLRDISILCQALHIRRRPKRSQAAMLAAAERMNAK